MRYRVGRHNPQLVYVQSGDEPDNKADHLIAVCFTAEMAAVVREALDGRLMLGTLASAAEAYLTRTEVDDVARDGLRVDLFDATTDAWLLLRPSALQVADEPSAVPAGPISEADRKLVARTTGGGIRSQEIQPQHEDASVSPPVDALLNLVDDLHSAVRDDEAAEIDRARGDRDWSQHLAIAVDIAYAAGLADGLDQATEGRTEVTIHVEPPGQRWQPEMTSEMRRLAGRWQPEGFRG